MIMGAGGNISLYSDSGLPGVTTGYKWESYTSSDCCAENTTRGT